MRDCRVVGLTASSFAAPAAPLIFQPVFWSTMKRFSRSQRRISASVRYPASAAPVKFTRNQFFSGARLTQHQDSGIRWRYYLDLPDDLEPPTALTDDFSKRGSRCHDFVAAQRYNDFRPM
jgi:hypothetical protein